MPSPTIQEQFGQIDIYLFDQILKGRISPGMRILDAGCGGGRNLVYFLRQGYEVFGADLDSGAVDYVRALARKLAPTLPPSNFRVEPVEHMSFDDGFADVVISNTIFHFATDDAHFQAMLQGSWRVLKPGGLFFCRLGSTIGSGTHSRPPLPLARWRRPISGRCGTARITHRKPGRRTRGPHQNHRRP